jgi:GMP synthase (glutamine-hydrolysing)
MVEADFAGVDGVIFTGSGETWATDAPEAAPQRAAMELAFGTGLPVWGSCNGLQLAAVVLGGAVGAAPNGVEIGLARDIQLTDAGRSHPAMAGRLPGFAVPCIHRDEVQRLPTGAQLLASNAHSPVQAMAYAKGGVDFWGAQYHPELTPQYIADLIRRRGRLNEFARLAPDLDRAETDAAAATRLGTTPQDMKPRARTRELANWLDHVAACKARTSLTA